MNDDGTGSPLAEELTVAQFHRLLPEVLDRIGDEGTRTYILHKGQRIAAVVPADEAEYLDRLEDSYFSEQAGKAIAEQEASGKPGVPLGQVPAELDRLAADSPAPVEPASPTPAEQIRRQLAESDAGTADDVGDLSKWRGDADGPRRG